MIDIHNLFQQSASKTDIDAIKSQLNIFANEINEKSQVNEEKVEDFSAEKAKNTSKIAENTNKTA